MYTEYIGPLDRSKLKESTNKLEKAARMLQQGHLLAFPTETIYGLGGVILNESVINQIFNVKKRPKSLSLPIAVANLDQIKFVAEDIPELCLNLMKKLLPGPLTIILKKKQSLSSLITGGKDTVAIRLPSDPIAKRLIEITGCPLALSSANISGKPSPTSASHVLEDLNGSISAVIDGGITEHQMESTILSFENPKEPLLIRFGVISQQLIEKVLGTSIKVHPAALLRTECPSFGNHGFAVRMFSSWNQIKIYLKLSSNGKRLIMGNEDLPTNAKYKYFKLNEKNLYDGLRHANRNGYAEVLVYCSPKLKKNELLIKRLKQIAMA